MNLVSSSKAKILVCFSDKHNTAVMLLNPALGLALPFMYAVFFRDTKFTRMLVDLIQLKRRRAN